MTSHTVSRAHRMLDLMAAALVIAGGALFSIAFVGLERLRKLPAVEYAHGMPIDQLARYHQLSSLSWAGLVAVAVGIGVGVYGWRLHHAEREASERA